MTTVTQIIQRRHRRTERRRAIERQRRSWWLGFLALALVLVVLPASALAGGTAFLYWRATSGLPDPTTTTAPLAAGGGPTELYDRSGETLLYTVADPLGETRDWLTLDALPPELVQATLLMEDRDFLTAPPPSLDQTITRLWQNVVFGPLPPDSSITARLVRNVIAPPGDNPTVADREREIGQVAALHSQYTPDEILEWHLNTNFYGNEAYGIDAAAQVYLGKRAADLTLDEIALLAAIPPAPQYNPIDNEVAARGRQDDVLRLLLQADVIDTVAYDLAVATPTPIQRSGGQQPELAPEFAFYARRQARDILNEMGRDGARLIAQGGLRIVTTLDTDLYLQTECALRTHFDRLAGGTGTALAQDGGDCRSAAYLPPVDAGGASLLPDTGAVALIDVATGEIKALVGPATATAYQPGPTLSPFVYFEGLRVGGLHTASMLLDIPRTFPGAVEGLIYTPANPDRQYRGPVSLREAMSSGLLPPAVQVASRQRLDNILRRAHVIGLNSLDENARFDLSLLESGGAVSVLDMAYAYSVFSALGEMRGLPVAPRGVGYRGRDPVAVLRIEDAGGAVLWTYAGDDVEPDCAVAPNCTGVFDDELGYLINDILADQTARANLIGAQAAAMLDTTHPAAVVSGRTSDERDAWTVGYSPHLVAGVWVGRSDNEPMAISPYATEAAAPVWRAVMDYAHARDTLPPSGWIRPDNIVETAICERSGMLPNGNCPVRTDIFIENIQPGQVDTHWQTYEVNTQTGQLATVNTPAGQLDERVYFVPPADALDWWTENGLPLPPTEYDSVSRANLLGAAAILQPAPFAYVGGLVDIRGSLDPTNMRFFQLAYGQGLNPETWTQIGEQQTDFVRGTSLGTWDTTGLDGLYSLRLTIVLQDNSLQTDVRQVTVDNTPPTLALTTEREIYNWPEDRVIPLVAEVQDNLAIERVEFFYNDELIGADQEWPYGFEWDITRTGVERFGAVVFDAVGNQTSAEITVEVRRSGG